MVKRSGFSYSVNKLLTLSTQPLHFTMQKRFHSLICEHFVKMVDICRLLLGARGVIIGSCQGPTRYFPGRFINGIQQYNNTTNQQKYKIRFQTKLDGGGETLIVEICCHAPNRILILVFRLKSHAPVQ